MCDWILAAWCSTSPKIVEKSFKVTGISNDMDGSEDFMINDIEKEGESNDNGWQWMAQTC